jgi:hypothetical protein
MQRPETEHSCCKPFTIHSFSIQAAFFTISQALLFPHGYFPTCQRRSVPRVVQRGQASFQLAVAKAGENNCSFEWRFLFESPKKAGQCCWRARCRCQHHLGRSEESFFDVNACTTAETHGNTITIASLDDKGGLEKDRQ